MSQQEVSVSGTSMHPLISQPLVDSKKYFCPFLARGFCREASSCNFSHDNFNSIKITEGYCHFYLANQCLYGQDCKFQHSEPNTINKNEVDSDEEADEDDDHDGEVQNLQGRVEELTIGCSSSTSLPVASFAKVCKGKTNLVEPEVDLREHLPLCPYASTLGKCPFPTGQCSYLHGLFCDNLNCRKFCLHPYNMEQQRQHREECLRELERDMENTFAILRSRDKVCGICMDTVLEKQPITSSRFGILEKCNHIFCLDCIRKWRGTKQFETRTIRACPECRVSSDFVVPSKFWVEDQNDKDKLIRDYKAALKSKPCKYFKEGKGDCPFADACFYKHAYPDGRMAELGTPKPRRKVYGARGPDSSIAASYIMWNILRYDETYDDDLFTEPSSEIDYETTDEDDDFFS